MKKNSFVEGTVFAYVAILLTKVMGALYAIPFYKIIGENGGVLYSYAYNVYNLFLNIATSGIPTAVSIIISEYNALKMFNEREHTYKLANKLLFAISFVTFLIMFIFAKYIAYFFVKDLTGGIPIESVVLVIRVISFCLLIIPFLSVTRGYLQGNKYVSVSSFSQLIEQFVRICIVLVGSYVAINVLHYSVTIGVSVALSGTVLGGLAAYLYLRRKIKKNKEEFSKGVTSVKDSTVKSIDIVKKILKYAIPIIIIAITQNIYEIIDIRLIVKGLYMIGFSANDSQVISSIVITWAPKICMVINALALGLCSSIIPFIVDSFVKKDYKSLNERVNQSMNTILFVGIPLSAFIIMFSKKVYYVFYGSSKYGPNVLAMLSIVSIIFSFQLVINMILQSMKKHKMVYINTIIGIVINACLDIPMILLLNKIGVTPYLGTLLATAIGQSTAIILVLINLKKEYKFSYRSVFKTLGKVFVPIIAMIIVMAGSKYLINIIDNNINSVRYLVILIELGIAGLVSVLTYVFISYKNGSMNDVLGEEMINKVLTKIKLKRS